MTKLDASRRKLLTAAGLTAGATFFGPWRHNRVWAQASDKPILIGITSDASGQYANSGASDRRGMMMAIDEFNEKGGLLGRQIETMHIDTETMPATGSRVAERLIDRENAAFLIGAVSSGVAQAISQVAQKYGVIYLNTNSSSPSESGENCHRVKFVYDGNGSNFARGTVKSAASQFGKKWLLLTNDYVWGHDTSAATRKFAEAEGVEIVDEILVPVGTRDFSAILLQVQQAAPDVVGVAVGGDDQKALRQQVAQLGMTDSPAWLTNQQDWPDIYGLPMENLFGVFGTTWYWDLDLPGVAEFVARYQKHYPDTAMKVPGNVFYNGYMATRDLLRSVERAGTTANIAVIKEMEALKISAEERMQHDAAFMDPDTHQMQQTIYLAKPKESPENPDDMFEIVAHTSPEEARDDASREACKLESYEDTPSYEM